MRPDTNTVAPSGSIISNVDVYKVKGVYSPCFTCYWHTTCVVPKGKLLPMQQRNIINYGDSDIRFDRPINHSNRQNMLVYHCQDYTHVPAKKKG